MRVGPNIDNFYNILKYNQNVRQYIRLNFRLKGVDFFYILLLLYTSYVYEL